MATKLYLIETLSDIDPDADINRKASLTAGDGSGLKTDVANTTASGTQVQMTDTAGGTKVMWISAPLNAVTISGSITFNFWMSENNMSANVGPKCSVFWMNAAGTVSNGIIVSGGTGGASGVELPVTTRAAQNYPAGSVTSQSIPTGDRIAIYLYGGNVGVMATGFTFDLGYNGTTGAADGDSWVQFTETITEYVPTNPPRSTQIPQLLAH